MRVFNQGTAPVEYVQIYGERNSGTTYFWKLLQDNMAVPAHMLGLLPSDATPLGSKIFGYKHWFIDGKRVTAPMQRSTLFVVIYRNPYTWIRAMMDRPYALEKSISGKSVNALPKVKLQGHINGRDTTNEFDPETGKKLTIFELRKKKIANFEGLAALVDNVAYVNLEELLDDPSAVIRRLASAFPTAFAKTLNFDRLPYKQLLSEYHDPERFTPAEHEVLDRAFDWAAETIIGYGEGHYGVPREEKTELIVLHGGSSVGKTFLMKQATVALDGFKGIEMDDCQYWRTFKPKFDLEHLQALIPDATEDDLQDMLRVIDGNTAKAKRCIDYLLKQLAELGVTATATEDRPQGVIATCGALPDPPAETDPSIYNWLSDRLPLTFHHVLIEIAPELHQERIDKRGRSHLSREIERDNKRRIAKRALYDATTSDWDGLVTVAKSILGAKHPAFRTVNYQPRAPRFRMHTPALEFIQIYGERNSGTKHLKDLVSRNAIDPDKILGAYATRRDPVNKARMIGYKHYYPRLDKLKEHQRKTLFLVIYKNPYTWIRSMMSKPYHFRDCFEGKTILDLPDIRLAGHDIHGRPIPDVHPETGDNITLFELRKFKIQKWEALAEQVANVAYVNYEDLLLNPTKVIQGLADTYPDVFQDGPVSKLFPDPAYVRKYIEPEPFNASEMDVMNAHIDWSVEKQVGYVKGNLFVPD